MARASRLSKRSPPRIEKGHKYIRITYNGQKSIFTNSTEELFCGIDDYPQTFISINQTGES
jgi:hypothetical protein